jgi:sterol desaturase/sphingolipid hydroxylase (fatty acid hydroxylase superfamily)
LVVPSEGFVAVSHEAPRISGHLSFVAAHKSSLESVVTTITDLLPIFILGYDINQLLAWVLVGTAYNLEGHSSLSLFFISSDFHDLHHTSFKGNYGIQGFWDKVFKTLNPPAYQRRMTFPASFLLPASSWPRSRNPVG